MPKIFIKNWYQIIREKTRNRFMLLITYIIAHINISSCESRITRKTLKQIYSSIFAFTETLKHRKIGLEEIITLKFNHHFGSLPMFISVGSVVRNMKLE